MDGHLVAVEVGVERLAHQRVDLDRLALDQDRLEGLDAETVQGGCAVEQHRVLLDHVGQDVPDLGALSLHHPLGCLDVLGEVEVDQSLHHERLEQLESHDLGQTALVQLELRPDHDDRAARVVDPLAQQVLAEPSLLALEHVGQRLEGTVARAGHRPAPAAVVEQGVDGLLEHPLLVVDDDLGGSEVEQPLEPVVPVDDPAVEIVEVGGGETATIELNHRPRSGGMTGTVSRIMSSGRFFALPERLDHLHPLGGPLTLLRRAGIEVRLEGAHLGVEVEMCRAGP